MAHYDDLPCPFCDNWIPEEIVIYGGECPVCEWDIQPRKSEEASDGRDT